LALLGAEILVLISLNGYVALNRSGHSGFDIRFLVPVFASIIALIVCLHWGEKRYHHGISPWLSFAIVAVSVAGIAEIFLLDRLAILVPYEEWLRRGMP